MTQMIHFSIRRVCLILWLLFITVGCDQATKFIARDTLATTEAITCCQGVVNFLHEENSGAFMSLGSDLDHNFRIFLFTFVVGISLFVGLIWLIRTQGLSNLALIAWGLILSGGFGNVIDRAYKGSVTDFLMLEMGSFRTGVFNVADMAISFGVLILAWNALQEWSRRPSSPRSH